MLLKYCHDFFDALIADALDLTEVFFNFPEVNGLAVFLQQSVSVAHQEGLKLLAAHFLYRTVGVPVDNLLFWHSITPVD